jgi:alkylation response protein AidB-like acyl-CoA dehydrogenase
VCRTDPDSKRHAGLSYLLVPMKQPGVTIRPIPQLTGDAEFFEVFYDGARTARENILGAPGEGWKVAMATLAFERGVSTLGQQMLCRNELAEIIQLARANGKAQDPLIRQRIADAWIGLEIQRWNALRTLSDETALSPAGMIHKLYWATWHRKLGELAMDVMGDEAEVAEGFPYRLKRLQRMFLFARSETIYGGSNQIQRNVIGERALGLPPEPKSERSERQSGKA